MTKILFIEPSATLDWTTDSSVSKAGRRHPVLNETGEQVYSYQNLSCASILRDNKYDVKYLHCPTQRLDFAMTKANIDSIAPFAIVIMIEHINANVAEAVSTYAKSKGAFVIWVGPFVTSLYKEQIENDCVDFILREEWDYSVLELVKALETKDDLVNVRGLVFKNNDKQVIVNDSSDKIMDMDKLPIPAYDLIDLSKFYESVFVAFPAATMISSRGCPYNCIYCSYPQTIYGHKFRAMSPERTIREIKYLVEDLGVKEIRFDDDTFNIDEERLIGICKQIIDAGLHKKFCYSVQVRPGLLTDEQAKWLKKSGCRMVLFGVESGNDEILKKIRKGTNKDEIRRGVKIAKKYKLDILNCVMLGFYWDTKETVEDTMNFAFELNAEFTQFSAPTPLPGTDYYDLLDENGCFITKEWEKHDSVHNSSVVLPNLTNEEINDYLSNFYKRYYRRIPYLWMMIMRMFRSWGNFKQSLRKWTVVFTK